MADAKRSSNNPELIRAMRDLTATLKSVQHAEMHPKRQYVYSFVRGIMQGLGVLVAAAVVIPLLVPVAIFMLQRIAWVPLVGNAVTRIIEQVELQTGEFPGIDGQ